MSAEQPRVHIHVMSQSETRMWRQPIRPLREWYQEDLVQRVEDAARNSGRPRALIYDADENLQWRSKG